MNMLENIYFGIILFLFATVTSAGEYCSQKSYGYSAYMYCSTSCCGDAYNRYCCINSNVWLIVGIVFGVLALVGIVVTVLVVVFCCCRKTRGQTGQVCQPAGVTTTVPVYGVQTATVATGYGQVGYANAAFPQQVQVSNLSVDSAQKWQEPPPSYSAVNPN